MPYFSSPIVVASLLLLQKSYVCSCSEKIIIFCRKGTDHFGWLPSFLEGVTWNHDITITNY